MAIALGFGNPYAAQMQQLQKLNPAQYPTDPYTVPGGLTTVSPNSGGFPTPEPYTPPNPVQTLPAAASPGMPSPELNRSSHVGPSPWSGFLSGLGNFWGGQMPWQGMAGGGMSLGNPPLGSPPTGLHPLNPGVSLGGTGAASGVSSSGPVAPTPANYWNPQSMAGAQPLPLSPQASVKRKQAQNVRSRYTVG